MCPASQFQSVSDDLVESLDLKYEPAEVTLYREGDSLPQNVPFSDRKVKSYCQAIALAGHGATLLHRKEQMGCKLGTSVLGFEKEMEAFLDDGVLQKYGAGLFGNEEAAVRRSGISASLRQAAGNGVTPAVQKHHDRLEFSPAQKTTKKRKVLIPLPSRFFPETDHGPSRACRICIESGSSYSNPDDTLLQGRKRSTAQSP
jgi:hypothetical protein